MAGGSRKRLRVNSESESGEGATRAAKVQFKRDTEVWFDDGNVVVVADRTAFKVHRGVLSLHSEVFRDMFSIPPPEVDEALEGCPIVRVSDPASDIRQLLSILYKGRTCLLGNELVQFQLAEGLVRMAHKYHIPDLKNDALARIKTLYTDDFYGFSDPLHGTTLLSYRWQDAFQVVRLAHLTDTKSLLPVALYLCCLSPSFVDVHSLLHLAATSRGHAKVSLSEEDMYRCAQARPLLVRAFIRVLASTFQGGMSGRCANRQGCKESYRRVLHRMLDVQSDMTLWAARSDCLSITAAELQDVYFPDEFFCSACQTRFNLNNVGARQEVWDELPRYLDLDVEGWGRGVVGAE